MGIPKIILDKMGKLSKIYTPFGENGNPILSRGPCSIKIDGKYRLGLHQCSLDDNIGLPEC